MPIFEESTKNCLKFENAKIKISIFDEFLGESMETLLKCGNVGIMFIDWRLSKIYRNQNLKNGL